MSKKQKFLNAAFTLILFAGIGAFALGASTDIAAAAEVPYGSAAAAKDGDDTIEEMLTYALQDEYMAKAEYSAIMDQYGTRRPFSNIVRSESSHIRLLLPLFEAYNVPVPADDAGDRVILPSSMQESYEAGVTAEKLNIAMYQGFLSGDLPDDLKTAFEKLAAASEKHLKAFEKAASRKVGAGNGMSKEPVRPFFKKISPWM